MFLDKEKSKKLKTAALSLGMAGLIVGALSLDASFYNKINSLSNDINEGTHRTVRIYDVNGDLLLMSKQIGNFDVFLTQPELKLVNLISESFGLSDINHNDNSTIPDDENSQIYQIVTGIDGNAEMKEVTKEEIEELQTEAMSESIPKKGTVTIKK